MEPLADYLKFGDLYLPVNQIRSIQFLSGDTAEIRIGPGTVHLLKGAAAASLKTYLDGYSKNFPLE